jgi:DNA polymerase
VAELERVLQLRLDYAQAATKKYNAIADKAHDGRMRETLQAWGAGRTGRWAGRGLQLQNLKRPPKNADFLADMLAEDPDTARALLSLEDLGSIVRGAIKAGPGKCLVVADLSSIEVVVLGWTTGCRAINDAAAAGKDPYKAFAATWFARPYEDITKEQRTISKPAVLGSGYGMGAVGLKKYAESMGIPMTEEVAQSATNTYRSTHPEVCKAWRSLESQLTLAVKYPGTRFGGQGQIVFDPPFLRWRLPSGRELFYFQPEVDEDGRLSYMGQNQYTNKWERIETWGGKVVENGVQAIARDVLVEGLRRYHKAGGTIVGHVHDEIIAEENELEAEGWLRTLITCMSLPVDWAPGLLLGAAGYVSQRYRKD